MTDATETAPIRANYPAATALIVIHALGLTAFPYIYFYGISASEAVFHLLAYLLGGLGITALYHRSWTHNAVRFNRAVEYFLAVCATFVVQMPARQWIVAHMDHHSHTDHEGDPYNIQKGFWWAHCEWIVHDHSTTTKLPLRLAENPVVKWQQKNYWLLVLTTNVLLPLGVAITAGAPWWSFALLSSLRIAAMENVVFSVNSVCHYWGTQPFSNEVSARDVWWFPFALGEQYHNYHHAFPRDYRHGIRSYDFDPTKWTILALSKLGLADNLVVIPDRQIERARASTLNSNLAREKEPAS